ncbi:MAG: tetratricopeptide repeat protein [Candidatus Thorarchaeota archaeon]
MSESPVIPEFAMFENNLEQSELSDIATRLSAGIRSGKDRFMQFTDVVTEYVGSGEWRNRSEGFLTLCAKASFLRGLYGYNQILAKHTTNIACKGYAAAAYCRQSLDPRWLNNLQTYVNQAWQSKDYVVFAELSGQLASILVDLGYAERAKTIASESIDKVTKATVKDEKIRNRVQAALLRTRILMAPIDLQARNRDEAHVLLDSADETARILDHQLALTDISYYRALILEDSHEYDRALELANSALQQYELMGYLHGVSRSRNLVGVIHMDRGESQDARDQFEELLVIQQQLNDQVGLAKTLINVGEVDRDLEQLNQMEIYNRRALEISQEAEYMRGISTSKINIGDVLLRRGEFEAAIKLYKESLEVAECSGMRDLMVFIPFLIADAYFMQQDYEKALKIYREMNKVAIDYGYPLVHFHSIVSEIVTDWELEKPVPKGMIEEVKDILGQKTKWENESGTKRMRDVRAMIYEDPAMESDLCVLYDREKNYDCRFERKSARKGCMGNLYWQASVCPHLLEFLEKLDE